TDELFDQIIDAMAAHGHNVADVQALWSIRKTLCRKELLVRREATSQTLGRLGTEVGSIPDDVAPRDVDVFHRRHFLFRWCLVFASAGVKQSRETALQRYVELKS